MSVSAKTPEAWSLSRSMDATSDLDLLHAVACRRDRQAFDEFYRRYERQAYNLASFLTGSRELAEEAVQESMLRVWKHAKTARDGSNIRGWVLRIVARSAFRIAAGSRKTSHREIGEVDMEKRPSPRNVEQEASVVQDEVLAALREELRKLTEENRHLVALYYGAGFTQQEISRELAIPQTTVSDRLRKVVETLRAQMSAAGFAAAAPLLGAERMADAVLGGAEVPLDLSARVSSALQSAARYSRRSVGASFAASYLVLSVAILLFAGLAGGAWWVLRAPSTPGASSEPLESVNTEALAAPAKTKPLYARWNFSEGPDAAIKLVQGEWHWERRQDSGAMVVGGEAAYVLLPIELPARPVRVRIEALIEKGGTFFIAGFWGTGREYVPNRYWNKHHKFMNLPGSVWKMEGTIYLTGQYLIVQHQDKIGLIREAAVPYPGNQLLLNLQGLSLVEIEIREVEEDEFPSVLRDIPGLIKAMGVEPGTMERTGKFHDSNSATK